MMFKGLLIVLFGFIFFVSSAQEVDKIVIKNEKKIISHLVVKGETVFRICKNYSITSEELFGLNPSISKGLKLGDTVFIPFKEKNEIKNKSSLNFKIIDRTTFSKVAALFNLKESELKALNPNAPNDLLSGFQLNVPNDSLLFKCALYKSSVKIQPDTIIQYVVEQKDVLYSIAKRFMTTIKEIQSINLKNNTSISTNSVLLIPIYDHRVLEMNYRTTRDLIVEQDKLRQEEQVAKSKEEVELAIRAEEKKEKLHDAQNSLIINKGELARIQKLEIEKKRLLAERLKKAKLLNDKRIKDSIAKVTFEKARIQKEEQEKQRIAADQLKKEQLAKDQQLKDSIAKVTIEKARIQKEELEKQRIAADQLKKEQLAKAQQLKDSIAKVSSEKARIQKEEQEQQRIAADQLKKEQLAKAQQLKDSIAKVTTEKARIQKEEEEKHIVKDTSSNLEIDSKSQVLDSTQFKKKFVLTFLLPFNSDKQNDPTSKVATEFYMGVQLALDSLSKLKFKGSVNVLDCGNDTVKLNALFLKNEVRESHLIIGPLNGINLIQTADFCNRNQIPMINPIMSNTALLRNNKFVYNAVSSEMSLVKGLAKYVYGKHPKDQVVLVKVGGKDEELYEEFRSTFSSQGANKLYEVTDTNMLSLIKKDKKSIFVVLSRDKDLATKISKSLSEYIDRNKLSGALTLYGTKDWLNFDAINEDIKKKIDFRYNSSIDFNSSNQSLSILRKKFKEKFKISLTKYAAQGYDVTFHFVKKLLMNSNIEASMMNVFNLNRIEQNSGFENGGSYVFGYDEGDFKRIQVLHD